MPADFHLESRSDMNLRRSFEKALEKIFNKSPGSLIEENPQTGLLRARSGGPLLEAAA